jgi:hypothetical protein
VGSVTIVKPKWAIGATTVQEIVPQRDSLSFGRLDRGGAQHADVDRYPGSVGACRFCVFACRVRRRLFEQQRVDDAATAATTTTTTTRT